MIKTDLWRVGIIKAELAAIVTAGSVADFETRWLPEEGSLRFMADPFGLWRDDILHIFAETYDYRDRHGEITLIRLDRELAVLDRQVVLREPWHLSYPFVFEAEGAVWMLPEGYRSGRLSLYRATHFPWQWERVEAFSFPWAAIDATPVRTDSGWLMFYTPPEPKSARQSVLRMARADHFLGPWSDCPDDPLLVDRAGARMGGTPIWHDGQLVLPTQDCSHTYGGAIRFLHIDGVERDDRVLTPGRVIAPPPAYGRFVDGLHTLSAAGPYTLVDAKRVVRSPRNLAFKAMRAAGLRARSA